jgi:2-polyprenyl-3-methyl-5-hydroxy-6-metoxy-1,4-benzoquinol methylase
MYISDERRKSVVPDMGIQYIPGHEEHFVDYVIAGFLPEDGILELGGGGLRFAIPVAEKGKKITVVDLDPGSLDIDSIVEQVNNNSKVFINTSLVKNLIKPIVAEAMSYLQCSTDKFNLITAFRFIHFLKSVDIETLFATAYTKLNPAGLLIISAITPYILFDLNSRNEIYNNSECVSNNFTLYRQFHDSVAAQKIMLDQNLSRQIHMIDEQYIDYLAQRYDFQVVEKNLVSTRIVGGYILEKS